MPSYSVSADGSEVWSEQFLTVLQRLNSTVAETGGTFEGNLCYYHEEKNFVGLPPDATRAHKRRNLFRATRMKRSLLEIGFNAGHSALIALSSNSRLRYVGVDICSHKYTQPCARILKEVFGDRFHFISGDSREMIPFITTHRPEFRFDVFHVDGGHHANICRTDISNCMNLVMPGTTCHLLLDDTKLPYIVEVLHEFIGLGLLRTEDFCGAWEPDENVFTEICRRA